MNDGQNNGPVLIELGDDQTAPTPAEVPAVMDDVPRPEGQAMQHMTAMVARPPSVLGGWFWRLLIAMITFFASLAAWNAVAGLIDRSPALGLAALGLVAAFGIVCVLLSFREIAALSRLRKVEALQSEAARLLAENDVAGTRAFVGRLTKFYGGRGDTAWGRDKLAARRDEIFDAKTGLSAAEDALLVPLDAEASRAVEAASRQVATVTALVPLAFVDILTALTANLRMIRRIAEIYGGRAGTFGAWRLTRAVAAHLVATGAVAVGDDLLGSVGGGHLLGKLSRRFGEGLVNGALTARVGVAAMEVCRPMPFVSAEKPRVTAIVRRSLTGIFDRAT
jgi:putative membrane protein